MSEFLNRITVQRKVIKLINNSASKFQLSGLSSNAIAQWKMENNIDDNNPIYKLLLSISSKLFFLSNKSQEQVTEEYRSLSLEVNDYFIKLEESLKNNLL